jgi:hypothetical protein
MRPLGDRRAHIRLEVVGALWGTLEFSEPTRVVNISATGAMIESPVPVARDSMQPLSLVVDGESLVINTHVRYMHRVTEGGDPPQYCIGVEFESPPAQLVQSIEQLTLSEDTV